MRRVGLGRLRAVRAPRGDSGLTLIELIITIAIMSIITVPLANFLLSYFDTYSTTQTRLDDSHDLQTLAAYFSQDVANTGLRAAATNTPVQSIWTPTSGFPSSYCGQGLGSTIVVLSWDDWSVTAVPTTGAGSTTGVDAPDSVAYVAVNGTLVRAYCDGGTAVTTSTTVVHNLTTTNPTSVLCPTSASACSTAPPPSTVKLFVSIQGSPALVEFDGQRRQAAT